MVRGSGEHGIPRDNDDAPEQGGAQQRHRLAHVRYERAGYRGEHPGSNVDDRSESARLKTPDAEELAIERAASRGDAQVAK